MASEKMKGNAMHSLFLMEFNDVIKHLSMTLKIRGLSIGV